MLGNPALFKLPHSLIQRFGCDMDVTVHRCLYTCVTQQLLKNLGLHAAFNRSCGVGVAQGVHAEMLDARLITEPV